MFREAPLNQSATVRPLKSELQRLGYNWLRWRYRMWARLEVRLAIDCCCCCEWSRNYSTTGKELVVLKAAQVRCIISLNRNRPSKNIHVAKGTCVRAGKISFGYEGRFCYRGTLKLLWFNCCLQEIVKLIALELCMLLCEKYYFRNRMVLSARVYLWNVFLTVQLISAAQRNLSQQCCGNYATIAKVLTVAGPKTDTLPDSKASTASLCFSNNFLDLILSLSNIRALSNSATTHAQIWSCCSH